MFLVTSLFVLFTSCASHQKVPYFQGLDLSTPQTQVSLSEMRIMPGDIWFIRIGSINPEAASIFNPFASSAAASNYSTNLSRDAMLIYGYLVDEEGNIDFPILGKLSLGGMNRQEASDYIKGKLEGYLQEATVSMRCLNYRVTIMGEVTRPATYIIDNERVNILEALGLAGDLTIYGKRDNVLVIRKIKGETYYGRINLNDPQVFSSPWFNLQQNDIVYVEPNKARAGVSGYSPNTSTAISVTSLLFSLANLLYNITN